MNTCKSRPYKWISSLLLTIFMVAIPLRSALAIPPQGLSQGEWNSIVSAISQDHKIVAADGATGDGFARSVSISGDWVVVGAYSDSDNGGQSGSAYVFNRNSGGAGNWGQVKKLLPADGAAADYFGESVAISGDTIIVGAWLDDDNGSASGSAYLFSRNQGGRTTGDRSRNCFPLTVPATTISDLASLSVAMSLLSEPRDTTMVSIPTKALLIFSRATRAGLITGENPGNFWQATVQPMASLDTACRSMGIRSSSAPFAMMTTAAVRDLPISSNATAAERTTGEKPVSCWPATVQQTIFLASASTSTGIR